MICRDCRHAATFGEYCARHWLVHGGWSAEKAARTAGVVGNQPAPSNPVLGFSADCSVPLVPPPPVGFTGMTEEGA
jgi:uncharacterized protein affecting Mg2+/Co2+ transport